MQLRPYQEECINKIINTFKKQNRQLIQLPTGAGKTIVFWEYISKYCKSALIVVPSVQLAEQVEEQSQYFIHPSQLSARVGRRKCQIIKPYHIVSSMGLIQPKMIQKLNQHHFDVIIIDEAHKSRGERFEIGLNKLTCFDQMLGVTATPYRTDQKALLTIFKSLSYSKKLIELIQQNYLSDLKGLRIETNVDLTNDSSGEDFDTASLYKQLGREDRNTLVKDIYLKHCKDKKTLIFCINIQHAKEMAHLLQSEGIKAQEIHGEIDIYERKRILKDFREGKIKVLTNAQLLTEGFDEPSVNALILARPTLSRVLYMQMIGRGTRKFPGKSHCLIIDIADNYQRLCSYLSIPFEEYDLRQTNQSHKDFLNLTEVYKEKKEYELKIKSYREHTIDFKTLEAKNLLEEPPLPYLNAKFPEWTTMEEALFLKWKERKLKEYRKWLASKK